MTRWSMERRGDQNGAVNLSEPLFRMDCRIKCGNDEIESPSRDALRARVLLTTAEDNQAKTGFDRRLMKAAGGGGFHPIASGT